MFSLSIEGLRGERILDCPAGACSFTAVGSEQGLDVTACDIAYNHSGADLQNKGLRDIDHAMEHMAHVKNHYVWDYFKDLHGLRKHRMSALTDCARDMKEFNDRYVPVTLPCLPFKDEEFDIILSAHFLFMYADRLDEDFHQKTIAEFLRVSKKEIRIFPLVDLEGKRYEHLDTFINCLEDKGCRVEEIKVPYEFQTGANSMLKIIKNC